MIHLPLSDLSSVDVVFGADDPSATPPESFRVVMEMIPFPDIMYADSVRIVRVRRTMSGGYQAKKYDDEPGDEIIATVESRQVIVNDAEVNRVSSKTLWMVRTPENPFMNEDDMFLYSDRSGRARRLVAEGPSVPQGTADVEYLTECVERT